MTARRADILVANLHRGDATSHHVFEVARLLRELGWSVQIHVNGTLGRLSRDVRSLARHTHPGDYEPQADLTLVEYAVWFPLAERLRHAPGAALFWYHGVTPPQFWRTETERDILRRSQIGAELAWHAHLAAVDSPFSAQELLGSSDYPEARVRVVPLGIDVASFQEVPLPETLRALRRRWGLKDRRVLLYTGRVAGNKRIDLLIAALAALAPRYPAVHLLVVGDTERSPAYREEAARLREQAERLGVADRVTLTGRVPVIEPYYHLAEVYVLPSQHECFGVPLVEGMAAEVPVIASASGSMPWVLDAEGPEPAGLTFAPGEVEDLVWQIARLLDDTALRQALIARGRERLGKFSRDAFRRATVELLSEVQAVAQEGPPPAAERELPPLVREADVALRSYRVRSGAPVVGPLIEKVRYNLTTHVKEAYLDRIVEQQVLYNRLVAEELLSLREEVAHLRDENARLREAIEAPDD
jgi:glycosyltransferase involved in cell wall biosynthesis